jgi:hypothetical protein
VRDGFFFMVWDPRSVTPRMGKGGQRGRAGRAGH